MNFKFLSVFIICLIIFLSVGATSASSPLSESGVVAADSPNEIIITDLTIKGIQKAIADATDGDTLIINGSISEEGTVQCNKNLHIIGKNDCNLNGVRWECNNGIKFENIIFRDCSDYYGGAIFSETSIDVINCSFNNNRATDLEGGAIYCAHGTVNVIGSHFFRNSANDEGGAIYCADGSVKVVDSSFYFNFATKNGGAIWSDDGVTIENCLFEGNYVNTGNGGAIYMDDRYELRISNSAFYSNTACEKGGAIYCDSMFSEVYLNSFNSFENNYANEGSVVYTYGTFQTVVNNWWGTGYPNWDNGLLIEWKAWPRDNIKHHDDSPLNYNPNLLTPTVIITEASAKYSENPKFNCNVTYNNTDVSGQGRVTYNIYDTNGNHIEYKDLVVGETYYVNAYFESLNKRIFTDATSEKKAFTVINGTGSFNINVKNITYDNSFIINITNATGTNGKPLNGTINTTINNNTYSFNINNGTGTYEVTDILPTGKYNVNATLNVPNYNIMFANTSFNINNNTGNFNIHIKNSTYGSSFIINITNATGTNGKPLNGTINTTINNNTYSFNINNGTGTYEVTDILPTGKYNVNATLNVPNYNIMFANTSFNINNNTGNFNIHIKNSSYGSSFIINITNATDINGKLLNGTANTTITYSSSSDTNNSSVNTPISYSYSFNVNNGTGSYEVTDILPTGKYNVNATLNISNYNIMFANTSFNIMNNIGSFNINVKNITYGSSFIINITNATGTNGKPLNGTVNTTINNYSYSFNIKNGTGTYEVTDILPTGKYNVSALLIVPNYDMIFADTSFSIDKVNAKFVNATSGTVYNGNYYKVYLIDNSGKALASQNVTIKIASKNYTIKTDKNGLAKVKLGLENKYLNKSLTVSYNFVGDETIKGDTGSSKIKVIKTPTVIINASKLVVKNHKYIYVKLTTKTGKVLANKVITMKSSVSNKTYKMKTNSKGIAKTDLWVKVRPLNKYYKYTFKYEGDNYYSPYQKTFKIKVVK